MGWLCALVQSLGAQFYPCSVLTCLQASMHQCHLSKTQLLALKPLDHEAWMRSKAGSHQCRNGMMTSGNVAKWGAVQYMQYRPQHRSLGHAAPQVLTTWCCPLHIDYLFKILKVGLKPAWGFTINTKMTRESLQKNLSLGLIMASLSCTGALAVSIDMFINIQQAQPYSR